MSFDILVVRFLTVNKISLASFRCNSFHKISSIKGNPKQSWILDSTPWITDSRHWSPDLFQWNLDSGFPLLYSGIQGPGFRISQAKFPVFPYLGRKIDPWPGSNDLFKDHVTKKRKGAGDVTVQ